MNVLSLFDGMGCAALALERQGFKIDNYFAAEIDKHAIKVTSTKFPDHKHLGSVTGISAKGLPKIDIILGGSPCQGFSFAGKGLNFNDHRSALFFEFVRLLEKCREKNPKVLFLLENVKMKKEYEDVISRILNIQPININSALVSAQNRERLYWTNINMQQHGLFGHNYCAIPQPKDKGIFLRDILQDKVDEKYFLTANRLTWWNKNKEFQLSKAYSSLDALKAICCTARQYSSWNGNYVTDNGRVRMLTPIEVCRLQTVPDDYFFIDGVQIVSDTEIYKMIGNGWTIDVITWILSFI